MSAMTVSQAATITPWKQNIRKESYHVCKSKTSCKSRQTVSSPRYVRTWSKEEETFLLEARKSRIPYKDIAARLSKTDLACRLHYHQMIIARKSFTTENAPSGLVPTLVQYSACYKHHSTSELLPPISATVFGNNMLLPVPIMQEPRRTGFTSVVLGSNHRRATSHSADLVNRSTLISPTERVHEGSAITLDKQNGLVDMDQIQGLYRDFAPELWSNIAAAYSHKRQLSPSEIENAFWQGHNIIQSEPSTPRNYPRSTSPALPPGAISTASTTTSQNPHDELLQSTTSLQSVELNKTKCSVSAILND